MAGINGHQVAVLLRVIGHGRNHPYPKPQAHIGLDNVGIGGGKDDVRLQPFFGKTFVEIRAASKTKYVSDQRVLGEFADTHIAHRQQRMVFFHHNATVPVVARQHDEVVIEVQRLGGDGEIGVAPYHRLGYLSGRALVHVQRNLRVAVDKTANNRWQGITGLGVGGGDMQLAPIRLGMLEGNRADGIGLVEHLFGDGNDGFASRGYVGQMLAASAKNLHTQLVFQHTNLLGNAGLRGIQAFGGRRDIEIVVTYFDDVTQLLQLHLKRLRHRDIPKKYNLSGFYIITQMVDMLSELEHFLYNLLKCARAQQDNNMMTYIVIAVIVILLVGIVVINVFQQQRQKQEAERRQEFAKQKAIIDETEALLPIAGQMPISSNLVAMLYGRLAEALQAAARLSGGKDSSLKSRAEDAVNQQKQALQSHRASDDNLRLPDNEQQMVQLLQAVKLLIAVLRTEFNKGKVDADTFRMESAFLDRIRLKINVEGLISRGVSAKIIKQLGSARQFLNKAKQLAAPHAHQDNYLRAKLGEIQLHLDEINANNGNLPPAKPLKKEGEPQQPDDMDLLFSPKKKW